MDRYDQLVEKYPQIFDEGFQISCGEGWYDIIDILCHNITWHIERTGATIRAAQIKEKFGTLRFYVDSADEVVDALIDMTEDLSGIVCESCGSTKDVSLSKKGWLKTKCKECLDSEKQK